MTRRPPRLPRNEYRGQLQIFFTVCAFERERAFADHRLAVQVLSEFLRTANDYRYVVLAYCLMPDHLHALIEGLTATSHAPPMIAMAKQRSGFLYSDRGGQRLWQEGFYDRVLRPNESAISVIR